jgi:hypothetical protein
LNNALEGRASAEDLQLLEKALGEQAAGLGAAGEERAELIRQIGLLEEQGITQEDLAAALEGRASLDDIQALRDALEGRVTAEDFQKDRERQDFFLKSFEDALKQTAKESTRSSEAIKALQAAQLDPAQIEQQRMAAITGAVDPIQAQIEKLRGEIPQQIDVEALRKQITQEVLAGMPQPVTNVQAPAVSVGPGTGGMDPYGQGGGYSTLPTTEGAAEMMGARPDYSAALNMSDGMAFANLDPVTNVQRRAVTGQPETPTANQELLDLFAANPATKQFGLTATFDPSTNQYVTDLSGAGFAGQTKRQTPEEFAAQLQTQKTTPVQQKPVGLSAPPRFKNMPIGRIGIR